jgi:hypothetical protein
MKRGKYHGGITRLPHYTTTPFSFFTHQIPTDPELALDTISYVSPKRHCTLQSKTKLTICQYTPRFLNNA